MTYNTTFVFRWPFIQHDLALANEVVSSIPNSPGDWERIAKALSKAFTTSTGNTIELKGRGCRERVYRLCQKHDQEDKKALKR